MGGGEGAVEVMGDEAVEAGEAVEEEVVVEEEAVEAGRGGGRGCREVPPPTAPMVLAAVVPRDDLGLELLKSLKPVRSTRGGTARPLAAVVVRDVGSDGVEEVVVVRDEMMVTPSSLTRCLQPVDRVAVEVGRLVEQQQLSW